MRTQLRRLGRRLRPAPAPEGQLPATWMLAVILALLLSVLSVAFVLTVLGPSGWDAGSFAIGVVTLLGTLLFGLRTFGEYKPGQFVLATGVALLVAVGAGLALYLALDAGPEDVTDKTTLRGNMAMGPGDEATATVGERPTGGELRLRLVATNESPGTPCLPLSGLAFVGGSLTEAQTVELEDTTEVTIPVDESAPKVTVTLGLRGAGGGPVQRGCRISLALDRADYN
ncbi:hypothetical protein [Streptomyces iconiensis]|uniref:Uncharacterized protein n=1 Tax=Streptomyces iconiensis TaxID=1384038 RepID=A0ABT6ZZC3_9ACTN|nr:hypothetical protein [Streptomyces iconiensis]MDJ1134421.1 hypothetical protein [Streptomyces iconiensis]